MANVRLTALGVERLRPDPAKRLEIADGRMVGLYLVVQPSGQKSWAVRGRLGGKPVKVTLGSYPVLALEQARKRAGEALDALAMGRDPRQARAEARADEERRRQETVVAVVERWLATDQSRNRTVGDVRGAMRQYVLPELGARPIRDVRKRDLVELIEKVALWHPIRANRTLAYLKRLFGWALDKELIEVNPAVTIKKPAREVSRDRVLDDAELVAIWRAAEGMDAYGKLVRLLLVTGARLSEIADAKVDDLADSGTALRLPAERSKNGIGRIIHLSVLAREVLGDRRGDFLVSVTGRRRVSNLSERKATLDLRVATARRDAANPDREGEFLSKEELEKHTLPAWRVHDLRRSVATGMQKLGERLETIETVLGHVSGSRSGVVAVYQRHRFEEEAQAALNRWASYLQKLLDPKLGKTVGLAKRQA